MIYSNADAYLREDALSTGAARVTYTPAEYLELERAAERKSEYLDGRIRAMTGASRAHNLIALNIGAELRTQLRGRSCEAYVADMRVKVSSTGLYTYPDVVVACEPIQLEDAYLDTLLNPTVIVEVLSPSTEAYDRGDKLAQYRRLESLRECLLWHRTRPEASATSARATSGFVPSTAGLTRSCP